MKMNENLKVQFLLCVTHSHYLIPVELSLLLQCLTPAGQHSSSDLHISCAEKQGMS